MGIRTRNAKAGTMPPTGGLTFISFEARSVSGTTRIKTTHRIDGALDYHFTSPPPKPSDRKTFVGSRKAVTPQWGTYRQNVTLALTAPPAKGFVTVHLSIQEVDTNNHRAVDSLGRKKRPSTWTVDIR